ncbi:RNA polymerase II-associated protein 3 [Colletes gigas]|uniref:RNA polymerase II-associated protein 3 n=1 Tax=Colletes gigas TaxID=935657 RepID=UPI001C9A7EA4|nr:RNA polymerase II-associated protein 3 [Colletes gigas]
MDANDTELVRVAKPEKQSLLERYGVPVEHLSYEYISECTDGKTLERLVTILRSGEEGYYPDLTRHAEERLTVIKPTSTVLRKFEPVIRRNMLEPSECKKIDTDINTWSSEMQSREKDLEEGRTTLLSDAVPQPEIRKFIEEPIKNNKATNSRNTDKTKRIASCDYSAWDKYDVDTELNKIDIRDEQTRAGAKIFQRKQKEIIEKKKLEKQTIIDKSSLTGTELNVMAEQEREKGNESFRAGDYEEALEHYNTSIKIDSNISAYNNRAMTLMKLQRYEKALDDCNFVLSMECTNVKALLRRAVTLEHLENPSEALLDYETVLKLEPTNPNAIAGVKKLRKPCTSKKVRMAIVEQEEDTSVESKSNEIVKNKSFYQQFESKLSIENNICFCDRAPGPSQNLRPRPHFKADYCLDNVNKQKETIKNDVSKKSELSKRSNSAQERSSSLFTNPKSIFSCAMPPKRGNSVIIEELPSEPCNNGVKSKSNEMAANKNNSNTNTSNTNKTYDDKKSKLNVKNVKKSHEQNSNSFNTVSSPREIQVADKYEIKTSKSKKCISKNFNNIENPYEFMRVWRSMKSDTDLEIHAQLLRSLNVDKLGTVLGNELDGNMFSTILRCLERHFCTPNDTELLNNFLKSFSRVKRFSIMNMFMNTEDKTVVKNILSFLEERGSSDVSSLRQIYCI